MFAAARQLFKPAPTPTPPTADAAWSETSLYRSADFPKYNPDVLLSRKGLGVYAKMMTDEQVKAVVRFKRDAITSRDYEFCCDHEELSDEEQQFRIAVFEYAVDRMTGTLTDALNGILSAMYNGFSLTEKIFQPIEYRGKTWTGVARLKLRPCDTFFFHVDEHGNIDKLTQKLNAKEQALDVTQFIHYVQNPEWDEHYGRSELRECYRAWFSKDIAIKFQNIHLERFATGFIWVQPKEGKSLIAGSREDTDLRAVLQNIQAKTAIILPGMLDLHIEHPATTEAYEKKIAQEDKAIAKALLVPNLLGITEQGTTGSYSQSETQLEAFLWTLGADAKRLADALNEQLFRELGDYNFGDNLYPYFKFRPISDKQQMEIVKTWIALVTGKAVQVSDTDEEYLRKLLEFPEKGEVLAAPADPNAPLAVDPVTEVPLDLKTGKPMEPAQMEETIVGKTGISVSAFRKMFGFNPDQERGDDGKRGGGGGGSVGSERQDISVIGDWNTRVFYEAKLKESEKDWLTKNIPIYKTAEATVDIKEGGRTASINRIDALVSGKGYGRELLRTIVADARGRGIDRVTAYVENINGASKNMFESSGFTQSGETKDGVTYSLSLRSEQHSRHAPTNITAFSRAMKRVDFAVIANKADNSTQDAVHEIAVINSAAVARLVSLAEEFKLGTAEGQPNDVQKIQYTASEMSALKVAVNKGLKDAWAIGESHARREIQKAKGAAFAVNDLALQDLSATYLKQKSYTLAGDISAATQKVIRNILLEGIKVSKSPEDTRRAIYKALEADGMLTEEAVAEALGAGTVKNASARIDTAIRTTSFEAINEARYSFFSDPALDGFVEALEYSAILDDRTTEICAQLNGETYGIDDAVWSTFRPPNHFNCRSILIPVTIRDTWTPGEEPTVLPQKGFGFSRATCGHKHDNAETQVALLKAIADNQAVFTAAVDGMRSYQSPNIEVKAGDVHVTLPEGCIKLEATINTPEITFTPPETSVVVNMPKQDAAIINVQPADVTLQLPDRKTVTSVIRDKDGNIKSTTQFETDA